MGMQLQEPSRRLMPVMLHEANSASGALAQASQLSVASRYSVHHGFSVRQRHDSESLLKFV
jgi:hypothetical protein